MSMLRYSWVVQALVGAATGAMAMLIIGFGLLLVSDLKLQPPLGLASIAGIAAAFALAAGVDTRRKLILASLACLAALALATFAMPFGVPISEKPFIQIIAALVFAFLVGAGCHYCLADMMRGKLSRYLFERHLLRLAKLLGLAFFSIIVALPFLVMLLTSLKSQQALLSNPLDYSIDLSKGVGNLLRSYYELFVDYNFGRFLLVTAFVSVATVVITLLFAVPGAYAVARLQFRGQKLFARSILMIYLVPAIVLVIPLYAVFSQLGLRDSLVGLLIVYPASTMPVALYMLQGYFRGLPVELEEAGLMDGLSRLAVMIKITLPLAAPALASVGLYVLMIAWNEFLFAFMFLDTPDYFTLSRGLVSLNSSEVPRQHLMAGAVIATVPVLVLFLWCERYLVQGLTAGSVKG